MEGVIIRDVMLRDGLQNIPEFIPTAAKIELFRLIVASGILEVGVPVPKGPITKDGSEQKSNI